MTYTPPTSHIMPGLGSSYCAPNGAVMPTATSRLVTSFNVTAAAASTPASGKVQYTTTVPHYLVVGKSVTVAGFSPAGYNGTFTVTDVGTNTFAVTNATTGTATPTSATVSVTSNTVIGLSRFYAPENITVSSLSVWLNVGQASGFISLGIYNTSGALQVSQTGTALNSLATLVSNAQSKITTSSLTTTGSNVLTAGSTYYCAIASNGATNSFGSVNILSAAVSGASSLYGTAAGTYVSNYVSPTAMTNAILPSSISTLINSGTVVGTSAPVIIIN